MAILEGTGFKDRLRTFGVTVTLLRALSADLRLGAPVCLMIRDFLAGI